MLTAGAKSQVRPATIGGCLYIEAFHMSIAKYSCLSSNNPTEVHPSTKLAFYFVVKKTST
ncbi:MAG: hypothetical protein JRM88_00025 [Nitrososphaerota archaeon]|nr:hypothetical protein [Nitrososphaerota archaeon]